MNGKCHKSLLWPVLSSSLSLCTCHKMKLRMEREREQVYGMRVKNECGMWVGCTRTRERERDNSVMVPFNLHIYA
jgi:hypothetical protein